MDEKVILRFRDGRTERVHLEPIDASREVLTVRHDDGTTGEVPFSELKAVFIPPHGVRGGARAAAWPADRDRVQ
jgi:hypothetical protein